MTETKAMVPTVADYEKLARAYCLATRGRDDAWEMEGIDEDNENVVATRETLEDFVASSRSWREADGRNDLGGAIFWKSVQLHKGDRRESLTVVDCGDFRLAYKV